MLIERVQDAQRTGERTRRLAKGRLAKVRIDDSKIGMVEDVEGFRSELQLQPFMNRKFPPDSQVHLYGIKSPREVSGSIAETRIHSSEGIRIDCPASRTALPWSKISQPLKNSAAIRTVQIDSLPWNKV